MPGWHLAGPSSVSRKRERDSHQLCLWAAVPTPLAPFVLMGSVLGSIPILLISFALFSAADRALILDTERKGFC